MANDVFHAKKALVLIKEGNSYKSVTLAKEVVVTPTVQGVARTVVLGTDLVQNVANHGISFKARMNLYLTKGDAYWMYMLGDVFDQTVYDSSDRNVKVTNVDLANKQLVVGTTDPSLNDFNDDKRWQNMGESDIIIVSLDNLASSIANVDNGTFDLSKILANQGLVILLKKAVLTEMDIRTRATEFSEITLGVETGQAEIRINNQVQATSQFTNF